MNYKHTQKGTLTLYISIFLIIIFWFIYKTSWEISVLYIWWVIFLFILLLFSSLTVEIDDTYLKIEYTNWIIKKSFLLSEIKSVKKVKNHWYYWWGIRVWFWPKMIIFNISWYDAIEINMNDGKLYRIWTDDLIELEEKLRISIK